MWLFNGVGCILKVATFFVSMSSGFSHKSFWGRKASKISIVNSLFMKNIASSSFYFRHRFTFSRLLLHQKYIHVTLLWRTYLLYLTSFIYWVIFLTFWKKLTFVLQYRKVEIDESVTFESEVKKKNIYAFLYTSLAFLKADSWLLN